jgi:hypothetical protein
MGPRSVEKVIHNRSCMSRVMGSHFSANPQNAQICIHIKCTDMYTGGKGGEEGYRLSSWTFWFVELLLHPLYIGNRSDNEYKVKHSCVEEESRTEVDGDKCGRPHKNVRR